MARSSAEHTVVEALEEGEDGVGSHNLVHVILLEAGLVGGVGGLPQGPKEGRPRTVHLGRRIGERFTVDCIVDIVEPPQRVSLGCSVLDATAIPGSGGRVR
jgi:hypothetical protein